MLLGGINHSAILPKDAKRLGDFYRAVFDAEVGALDYPQPWNLLCTSVYSVYFCVPNEQE